ncbi:MAG: hypothetical protein K9L74_07720 [Candidatus Izimaplasma sp.]|nr:hypothetical protein [Candidatus Izimaplasma bacterium]
MINISETTVPDITKNNIDRSKQNLAESIIEQTYPLFDELYLQKEKEYNDIEDNISITHKNLLDKKQELEELMNEVKRKRKVNKLLKRIEKIIFSGITFETSLKHETIILLKTIDKMSDERLDYNLNRTMKIISKRFASK